MRDLQVRDRIFDRLLGCTVLRGIIIVLLGKGKCVRAHVHSLGPGVSGYLVGQ